MPSGTEVEAYPEVMVDDIKVGELGEEGGRRQGALHDKLDLPGAGAELVADLEADPANDDVKKLLDLDGM